MDPITEKIIGSVAVKLTTDGIHKFFNNETLWNKVERALQKALDKVSPDNEFWKNDVQRQRDDVITVLIRILDDPKCLENNPLPSYLDKETVQCFENYLKEDVDTWIYMHQLLIEYISRETREISRETRDISSEVKEIVKGIAERIGGNPNPIKEESNIQSERLSLICKLIQKNNRITLAELAQKTSCTSRTIKRDLNVLVREGIIKHEGSMRQGYWVVLLKE